MIPEGERIGAVRLSYVLLFAMGFATLTGGVLGILGPFLLDELGITRAQLGWLITFNTISGALISVTIGGVTDRIGGFAAVGLLGVASATALVVYSISHTFVLLAVGALCGGFSQSFANPSTNKLVALHISQGSRGVVMGIKQSGVYVTAAAAGIAVPAGDLTIGWRPTLLIFAGVALGFTVSALVILPNDRKLVDTAGRTRVAGPVDPAVWWLTSFGFLHGTVSSFSFLFPLYATEALDRSEQFAGAVVAASAIGALIGRIVWARVAERLGYTAPLLAMTVAAIVAVGVILSSLAGPIWLAIVGGVAFGASTNSWNSVGMLAVTNLSGSAGAGRGTGIVLTGFLTGVGVGPPILGWLLDQTESYTLVWSIEMMVLALSIPIVLGWRAMERRGTKSAV